jgi:hypothetical protein
LHEDAQENNADFEVIYVSSDDTQQECDEYMKLKHGDWLRVSWNDRQSLKQEFGVFAGKEQSLFPSNTKRRSGIPTLVVIDANGKELDLLDCDNSTVINEIETKGSAFLDKWKQYKW